MCISYKHFVHITHHVTLGSYDVQHAGPPVYARCQETGRTRGLNPPIEKKSAASTFFPRLAKRHWTAAAAAVAVLLPRRHAKHGTTKRSSDCAERRGCNNFDKWEDLFSQRKRRHFFFFSADTPPWMVETLDSWCIMPSFFFIPSYFVFCLFFIFTWLFQPVVSIRGMHLCS